MRRGACGFTLIELAVVIAIVGLLLGGILVPLATQIEVGRTKEARSDLDEIKEALYGFALANGRLPCPDSDDDGQEDRGGGADNDCAAVEGQIPGVDLGLTTVDPWGAQYIYRVTNDFADDDVDAICGATGVSFGLCTVGDIIILDAWAGAPGAPVATAIPALVVSQGSNWGTPPRTYRMTRTRTTTAMSPTSTRTSVSRRERPTTTWSTGFPLRS